MKFRHKRNIRRVVAWISAFLLLYAAAFGNWIVIPFAVGFALVQFPSCFKKKSNNSANKPEEPDFPEVPLIILLVASIAVFICTNAICATLCILSGAAGIGVSYMLLKVPTGKTKKKKKVV